LQYFRMPDSVAMASLKTEGIILQRKQYREMDLLVTFFSPDFGKLIGLAFGAKRSQKRFANCLELFNRSRIFFSESPQRSVVRLEMCELISGISHIPHDMSALAHASYLAELVELLTGERDQQNSADTFHLLNKCLEMLESGVPPEDTVLIFEMRLLSLLGYALDLRTCADCKAHCLEEKMCRFYPADGRLRCNACAQDKGYSVSGGTIKTLQFIQEQPLEVAARARFPVPGGEEARLILEDVLTRLMQRRPKSLEYIRRLKEK
jgi:DNA repair protein RecO (recombination protein O)